MSNPVIDITEARRTESTELEKDLARRELLKQQEAAIKDELATINARLVVAGFGKHEAGGYSFTVSHNRRIDAGRIAEAFPVVQYPMFYKPAIDLDAVKQNLSPAELARFYNEGAPVVR